jgi:hypothetical protein
MVGYKGFTGIIAEPSIAFLVNGKHCTWYSFLVDGHPVVSSYLKELDDEDNHDRRRRFWNKVYEYYKGTPYENEAMAMLLGDE